MPGFLRAGPAFQGIDLTKTLRILLCAAVLTSLGPARVRAADTVVPVRIDGRDGARLSFDFPRLVPYEISRKGDTVEMTFDTAASVAPPARLPAGISKFDISRPDPETLKIVLTLRPGVTVSDSRQKRAVVLTAALPKPKEAKQETPPEKAAPEKKESPPQAADAAKKPEPVSPVAAAHVPAAAPPDVLPAAAPETVVTVSTAAPTRIAVFRRAGFLWIVDDGQSGSAFAPEIDGPQAGFLGKGKPFRFKDGSAWRYTMPPNMNVSVRKKGLLWQIVLSAVPATRAPASYVSVEHDGSQDAAKLKSRLPGAGPAIVFEDPAVGDALSIVPTGEPNARIDQARAFPDVEILSADMGFVTRPLRDGVKVARVDDYAFVTAPDGLKTSIKTAASVAAAGPEEPDGEGGDLPLFNFPSWRMGGLEGLHASERELIAGIAEAANPDDKTALAMALARLYFANNFGQESLGALRMLETLNPDVAGTPDFLALRGAASAMAGHYDEALSNLSDPSIQKNPEVALWIGYAAAATEQWRKADESFPRSNRLLRRYPDNVAIPFTIYMAESALRLGRVDTATALLDSLSAQASDLTSPEAWKAAAGYLRGEAYRQQGNVDAAIQEWTPVAEGRDRLYHSKASLALTNLLLQEKKISVKDAVERVDSLRFAWRGDGLEVQILKTLGQMKIKDGQYLSGLADLKSAAKLARSLREDTEPIEELMRKAFLEAYTGDEKKVQPLEAISIYQDYADIMPPGPETAAASRRFAGYLVRMDLLGRAAKVLEDFLPIAPSPVEAGAAGEDLAAIYLRDGRPAEALKALDATAHAGLTASEKSARLLLRARAQSRLNQPDDAIRTLAELNTPDAQRLKADVLWSARRWPEASQALQALLPAPSAGRLDEASARLVVNAAVAAKLAGDTAGLDALKTRYGASLAGTPLADAFGVVTRGGGVTSLSDRGALLKMAGEVDMFKGFLDKYKATAKN